MSNPMPNCRTLGRLERRALEQIVLNAYGKMGTSGIDAYHDVNDTNSNHTGLHDLTSPCISSCGIAHVHAHGHKKRRLNITSNDIAEREEKGGTFR